MKHERRKAWVWPLLLASGVWVVPAQGADAVREAAKARFFGGIGPLEAEQRKAAGIVTNVSAGLFVGVNEFAPNSGLPALKYAVDDALALAQAFVLDLGLIAPHQTTLALGGKPGTEEGRQTLAGLQALGASVRPATREAILDALLQLADRANDPQGLAVLSLSTHGYEEGGAYIMPENGRRRLVRDTGVALETVERTLRQARANKVLLILDACRREETKGDGMSEALFAAMSSAEGFGILLSCGVNQFSWEAPELGHGVYTYFLLEALRGGARAETNGLIFLDGVASYAGSATARWAQTNKGTKQTPYFNGPETARRIPLAVDRKTLAAIERIEAEKRAEEQKAEEARQAVQRRLREARRLLLDAQEAQSQVFPLGLKQQVELALQTLTGNALLRLLGQVELLKDPKAETAESFVAWWQVNGRNLSDNPPAPPVFGDQQSRYTNSLGMVFTAVAGVMAKFSLWETRVMDFRAFVQATGHDARSNVFSLTSEKWVLKGATWEAPGFAQTELHPVCGVSWEDAQAFCRWLTQKERQEGRIGPSAAYRLPRDAEWSTAAGPGKYVWGEDWPPPRGAGNFAGEEASDKDWPKDFGVIVGYNDGYARTSPVGSFRADARGLHDMAGNVWEWCEDWYRKEMNTEEVRKAWTAFYNDGGGEKYRLLRGGSWFDYHPLSLASSLRDGYSPERRGTYFGFRCVLGEGSLR